MCVMQVAGRIGNVAGGNRASVQIGHCGKKITDHYSQVCIELPGGYFRKLCKSVGSGKGLWCIPGNSSCGRAGLWLRGVGHQAGLY